MKHFHLFGSLIAQYSLLNLNIMQQIQSISEIPSLLVRQVTAIVQWHKSIRYCKERGINNFILLGPARVLANLLKKEYPLDFVRLWL